MGIELQIKNKNVCATSSIVPAVNTPPFNFAVFSSSTQVGLVRVDGSGAERNVAEAAASGFLYCGAIGVNEGQPKVSIEPGREAECALAGLQFVGVLGVEL